MAKVLIIGEFKDGKLKGNAGELIAAARQLGDNVDAALLGPGSTGAADGFGAYGVGTVHVLDGGDVPTYSSDGFAAALTETARGYDYVVASHSFFGRDTAARLAAALGGPFLSDVTAFDGGGEVLVAKKPLYAGKVTAKFRITGSGTKVITIRPKVFAPTAGDQSATVSTQALAAPAAFKSKVTSVQAKAAGAIDVKDADIIITGGRGVGGPEGFAPLRDFAQAIGCALGASRAAVDAGWIEHSHQVGQTGKVVNPKLYIACGVSGAIQHLAGMQTSRVIVAINSNESAPIFKIADYGIVGDLFEIVPELQRQILAARG
jgi:electron transfer flavoprotein alpha subunit